MTEGSLAAPTCAGCFHAALMFACALLAQRLPVGALLHLRKKENTNTFLGWWQFFFPFKAKPIGKWFVMGLEVTNK